MSRLLTWKEMPIGGMIVESGNSRQYNTGSWRTYRPVHIQERCISCLRCWILCPDSAVLVVEEKMAGFDYAHCKGCGICARECPKKRRAIEMKLDKDVKEDVASPVRVPSAAEPEHPQPLRVPAAACIEETHAQESRTDR